MNDAGIKKLCTERMPLALERAAQGKCTSLYDSYFDDPNRYKNKNHRLQIMLREDLIICESLI